MVDLSAKPFFLNEEQQAWVRDTFASMTLEEKFGQLFVLLKAVPGIDENAIAESLKKTHQGGLRWQGGDKDTVYRQNKVFQEHSRIPLLVAANCDEGGSGCLPEGTFVATAAQAGASPDTETAYHIGLVSGREARSIGCNWMFNPVTDIYMNWRNTIVNTRSFGGDAEKVIENSRAYIRGVRDASPNMACCMKHFPGDGVEELDQHLAMGVNSLGVEEWENTFGYVYRTLIEDGIESVMVGHIALPEMSRRLRPGIRDEEIMPATLAKELLTDLLRGEMGFNGVIITDATHMLGLAAMAKRSDAIPGVIAAGCDMILFANDPEEDLAYLKAGYEAGIVTPERLDDAVLRILGLKARLNLFREEALMPDPADKDRTVGCEEHRAFREEDAFKGVTLVKDTRHNLPVDPAKKPRAFLVYVQSTPTSKGYQGDPVRKVVREELERAGFIVDDCPNYHDLEVQNGVSPMNFVRMLAHESRKSFTDTHDVAFIFVNVKGYAQENNVRLRWSCNHSCEMPWYNLEVPTIAVSLNYTNHLIDLPQVHTFINAYGSSREHIRAAVEKICGRSPFLGSAEETVFCGRWDTRL